MDEDLLSSLKNIGFVVVLIIFGLIAFSVLKSGVKKQAESYNKIMQDTSVQKKKMDATMTIPSKRNEEERMRAEEQYKQLMEGYKQDINKFNSP